MLEIVMRLGILAVVGMITVLLVWMGRSYVEAQRRRALAARSLDDGNATVLEDGHAPIRILAFSSADCRQCHQLQEPALKRVVEARGDVVSIVDVDATSDEQMVQTYHVLTVPSTVILDAAGNAHAVNYGFANTQRLLDQVDEVLAKA
ncbi:MAG TPA: thioredoxin domain-containing protein [Ktedonobacteraceae bacterium]|nr:thioredoxin domain-containing protein [Ktedonobacteraceae bacterium]